MHKGYIYTADRTRGVDVLKLTGGAKAARLASREVRAPAPSARQRQFLAQQASLYRIDQGPQGSACCRRCSHSKDVIEQLSG